MLGSGRGDRTVGQHIRREGEIHRDREVGIHQRHCLAIRQLAQLLLFQVGVVEVLRPTMERLLVRPRWALVNDTVNRFALPLYLFHSTGMALSRFITWRLGLSAVAPPERGDDLAHALGELLRSDGLATAV